jgi:hypothetical protein
MSMQRRELMMPDFALDRASYPEAEGAEAFHERARQQLS